MLGTADLVERDEVLKTLQALLASSATSSGQVAVVSGEAGLGKTSLLETFASGVDQGVTVAWGRCDDLFTPRQLGAFNDIAGSLGREAEEAVLAGSTPAFLFPKVFAALSNLPPGSLLVFEDVHWADHASLDLLKFIVRRIAPLRLLIVLTYRPDELGPDHPLASLLGDLPPGKTTRLALQPLTEHAVAALAAPAGRDGKQLYRVTAGNPFFLSEILAHPEDPKGLPSSVRDAVLARVSRVSQRGRQALDALSIAPDPVSQEVLARLLEPDAVEACATLQTRGLLIRDQENQLRFCHELARLAVYDALSDNDRRRHQRRLLDVYLQLGDAIRPDLVVHHAAALNDAGLLLAYAPRAAALAAAAGACKEAAAQLAVALKHVEKADPEQAATLYEDWAYQTSLFEITDEVIAARREAIARWKALDRPERVGDNLRSLWRLHWYCGETDKADAAARESLEILEAIPPSMELGRAYSFRSHLSLMQGRRASAVAWGEKAVTVAEQFADVLTQVQAMVTTATALLFSGHSRGCQLMDEALVLAHEAALHEEIARIHTNYAEYAIFACDWPLAERLVREGLAFDIKHGLDAWTTYLKGRHAQLYLHRGRFAQAETLARSVLEEEGHTILMQLPALITLATVRSRLGGEDAENKLQEVLKVAIGIGEQQRITPLRLALIQHHYVRGQLDIAQVHAKEMLAFGTDVLRPWDAGALRVWLGRLDLPDHPGLGDHATAAQTLELAGDYAAAAALCDDLELPFEAALCRLAGARRGISGLADEAANGFAAIACDPGLAAARQLGAGSKARSQRGAGRRGPYRMARKHPLGLTRREVEILAMMAEGASNSDIAHSLSRSPRTVEHHVSSILGKLSASNRLEATLRVIAEPWIAQR